MIAGATPVSAASSSSGSRGRRRRQCYSDAPSLAPGSRNGAGDNRRSCTLKRKLLKNIGRGVFNLHWGFFFQRLSFEIGLVDARKISCAIFCRRSTYVSSLTNQCWLSKWMWKKSITLPTALYQSHDECPQRQKEEEEEGGHGDGGGAQPDAVFVAFVLCCRQSAVVDDISRRRRQCRGLTASKHRCRCQQHHRTAHNV